MDKAGQMPQAPLNRRAFIQQGSLFLAGSTLAGICGFATADEQKQPMVRVGLVTDLHFADREPAGTRHYRETPAKLTEAAKAFQQEKVDLVVALGDLIDSADSLDEEKNYLRRIAKDFTVIPGQHHFVLGSVSQGATSGQMRRSLALEQQQAASALDDIPVHQIARRYALVKATIYSSATRTNHNPLLAGKFALQNLRRCTYIKMKLLKPTPGLEVCEPEGSPDYWGVISEMASVRVRCPTNSPQSSSFAVFARCDGVHQREHRNQNHPLAFVSLFFTSRFAVGSVSQEIPPHFHSEAWK